MKTISPVVWAFFCVLAWSFISVVARLGQSEMSGLQFLFWTNVFSALALFFTISFKKHTLKKLISSIHFGFSILLGFLGGFFYYLCLYFGYAHGNSVEVLLIQYTWPALVSLLAVFLLHEKITFKKILAVLLGAFSAILVITKGDFSAFQFNNVETLAVVFMGAVAFALFSVVAWSSSTLVSVLANGIFINGLSYILWIYALEKSQASNIAPLVYLTPLLSIFWLVLFWDETFLIVYFFALVFSVASGLLSLENKIL